MRPLFVGRHAPYPSQPRMQSAAVSAPFGPPGGRTAISRISAATTAAPAPCRDSDTRNRAAGIGCPSACPSGHGQQSRTIPNLLPPNLPSDLLPKLHPDLPSDLPSINRAGAWKRRDFAAGRKTTAARTLQAPAPARTRAVALRPEIRGLAPLPASVGPVRTGTDGISWDLMVVNGLERDQWRKLGINEATCCDGAPIFASEVRLEAFEAARAMEHD